MRAVGCDILFDGVFRTESPIVVHSVFSHAANMLCDDVMYAIVSRDGYDAPATAVLRESALFSHLRGHEGSYVLRRHKSLLFETGDVVECGHCARHDARLRTRRWDRAVVEQSLKAYELRIRKHVQKTDSLMFYAARYGGMPEMTSASPASLANALSGFVEAMDAEAALDEAVLRILGAGMGLTPAGDDVLCGFLCVFAGVGSSTAQVWQSRLSGCLAEDKLVSRTTIVSTSMLENACKGMAALPYRAFVDAMLCAPEDVARSFDALLSVGASSGIDFSVGVACALRFLLKRAC